VPLIIRPNQSSTHSIFTNTCRFFILTFIVTQSVVEEISLPIHLGYSDRDSLEVANRAQKLCIIRNPISICM